MSEYQTQDRLALLLGNSSHEPGRISEGYDACGGTGTLLFDEIEKAHPRVLDILLQVLEPARLTTGSNRVLDFSTWYVAMTSDIGAARIMAMRRSIYKTMRRLVQQDAQRELRPEIFARITEVVVRNRLDFNAQMRIAAGVVGEELEKHRARGHEMALERGVTDAVINRGYSEIAGTTLTGPYNGAKQTGAVLEDSSAARIVIGCATATETRLATPLLAAADR